MKIIIFTQINFKACVNTLYFRFDSLPPIYLYNKMHYDDSKPSLDTLKLITHYTFITRASINNVLHNKFPSITLVTCVLKQISDLEIIFTKF
jgi:hypothetical protein